MREINRSLLGKFMDKVVSNIFKKYLEERDESPFAFAKRSGINEKTVYKAYRGEVVRKDIAKKIVRCTKKQVTLKDLGYE